MSEEHIEEHQSNPIVEIAKSLVAIEEPMPEKADFDAMVKLLGRIEHELVIYRRERLLKTYLLGALVLLPLIGLGYLIPEFLKSIKFQ